jgi:hypothetical protein
VQALLPALPRRAEVLSSHARVTAYPLEVEV